LQAYFDELLSTDLWHQHPVLLDFFNVGAKESQGDAFLPRVNTRFSQTGGGHSYQRPSSQLGAGGGGSNTSSPRTEEEEADPKEEEEEEEDDDAAYADTMNWIAQVEEAGSPPPSPFAAEGQRLSVTRDAQRRSIASGNSDDSASHHSLPPGGGGWLRRSLHGGRGTPAPTS